MSQIQIAKLISPSFDDVWWDIEEDLYTHYWLKGGRGSTKSSFWAIRVLIKLIQNPLSHACILRKVKDTLRDSVYSQLIWALSVLQLTPYFKCSTNPMQMTYIPTGQIIFFRGADDYGKIKSLNPPFGAINIIVFEEIDQFNGMDKIRNMLQSLLRGCDTATVIYSYNPPKSANSWVNKEILIPRPDRKVYHSTYLQVPKEWLGEVFINEAEELKRINPKAYAHEYLGEVVGTGGQVFDMLEVREITDAEIATFGQSYQGVDFGWFPDPTVWTHIHYDSARLTIYIYDEIYSVKLTNSALADMLKQKKMALEYVYCDCADPRSINELKLNGVLALPAAKGAGSIDYGIKWLAKHKIVIDPKRCPNTAREFSGYELERDKNGEFITSYPDRDNHSIDSARYALERIMKINKE